VTLNGWVDYAAGIYFETGVKAGVDHIADTGLHAYEVFKYENRPEEHFYGLGPHSSKGDGSVYEMEATTLESIAGYTINPTLTFDGKFAFSNINISGGHDGGRGQIREHPSFSDERVPGIAGERIITVGAEIHRDTRNHKVDSTKGGDQRLAVSFNEGLGASGARYLKWVAEASQYLSLKSERRVLVFHFYGEHNNELGHKYVPFHQMAKLGDYGTAPYLSHTLRAYNFNRFFGESAMLFNVEYRYTIWEYKDMKVNSVIFWDEGQVFNDFGDFKASDFRESYGLGFRFSIANNVLLSFEAAHGDEGTRYYVKSTAPF
jgi:outer membrane protein assembly factor BamA